MPNTKIGHQGEEEVEYLRQGANLKMIVIRLSWVYDSIKLIAVNDGKLIKGEQEEGDP